jgi:hypothetical protein
MITTILSVIALGLFYSFFMFFYLEDIQKSSNKPLVQSAFEALVETIAFTIALLLFYFIFLS